MTLLRSFFVLSLLIAGALPAIAAEVSMTATNAAAGSSFALPVMLTITDESLNALEGSILVPEGIQIDDIEVAGSALTIFVQEPAYMPATRSIEFTGGAPKGLRSGQLLLFTIRAHANAPGTYRFIPERMTGYANDGSGTGSAIGSTDLSVSVGVAGSVPPAEMAKGSTPLIADVGRDASLFEGKWFATFYGGASGANIDHYLVQESWWRMPTRANRYYVLEDQKLESTIWVTAVSKNGEKVSSMIPAANPWKEIGILAAIVVVALLSALLVWRRFRPHIH